MDIKYTNPSPHTGALPLAEMDIKYTTPGRTLERSGNGRKILPLAAHWSEAEMDVKYYPWPHIGTLLLAEMVIKYTIIINHDLLMSYLFRATSILNVD